LILKITNPKKQVPKKRKKKNQKSSKMENSSKIYDLEERTALYAEIVRKLCLKLPNNMSNV
jgi:hypothetical protein